MTLVVSVALVVWIVVNLWLPLVATGLPVRGYGVLSAAKISRVPDAGTYRFDDEVYRRTYYLMHQGQSYYPAFRDAWTQQTALQPAPSTPMGFRLPTLFWMWRLLPAEAFSLVYLFLGLGTLGVASAAWITGQLAGTRFAPLAAATTAAYVMSVGMTAVVTYVDLPAACIALAGLAFFVHGTLTGRRSSLWTAVAIMTFAALTREILAYLIVLGALSSLLEPRGRRLRAATPWLAGLGVFGLGYAAHTWATWGYLSSSSPVSYWRGSFAFALNALTNLSETLNGHGPVLLTFFLVGVIGAYAIHRRVGWPLSAFALAALLLPAVGMLRFGNASITPQGAILNYWGLLFVPIALALWPTWTLIVLREDELDELGPRPAAQGEDAASAER
jgi:hypothetical protein